MKILSIAIALFFVLSFDAASQRKVENLIIITLDGMRWQEIFAGIDTSIAKNPKFNQSETEYLLKKYDANDPVKSRQKLMPFLWSAFEKNGLIYGNRKYESYVNVSNPFWISYPGYSEIFCGMVDTAIVSNKFTNNRNINFLETLNNTEGYKNKVAIFGAWAAFPYIFNTERNHLPISSAFKPATKSPTEHEKVIRSMLLQSFKPFGEGECLDVFTHFQAMEYLKREKPKTLFIGYGETDEWAHAGKYKFYLDAANQTDAWIAEIWKFVQSDPFYKDKTLLVITTDHGRGVSELWTDHNSNVMGADQAWLAMMGPGIKPMGEIKQKGQIYHKQIAITLMDLMGIKFTSQDARVKPITIERTPQ